MRNNLYRVLPLVVIALAFMSVGFSCPTGPVALCEAQLRAQCHQTFSCCKESELSSQFTFTPYITSEGECFDRIAAVCKAGGGSLEDSIGLGRLRFNMDKAGVCADAANAAADKCDASLAVVVECGETTSGLVEDGDDCALSVECGEGGFCEIDGQDPDLNKEQGALEGRCRGPAQKGDDCGDTPCARGLVCDVDVSGNGTCDDAPADGDDCVSFQCGAGLFCNADTQCETLKDDGDNCAIELDGAECKTGRCTDGECGTATCDGK